MSDYQRETPGAKEQFENERVKQKKPHRGPDEHDAECLEKALVIHRAVGNHAWEGVTLGNLGLLRQEQGRMDEAVEHYLRSLEIVRAQSAVFTCSEALRAATHTISGYRLRRLANN